MGAVVVNLSLALLLSLLMLVPPAATSSLRWDDQPDCHDQRPPTIVYKTTSMETFEDPGEFINILYGEDITVLCTGNAIKLKVQRSDKHLNIIKNATYLETEEVSNMTIRWNISRPDVDRVRYRCVDIDSKCQDSLYFMVAPRPSVVAAGVRHKLDPDPAWSNRFIFYVPHGETYQILCSGDDAKSLKIHLNSWTLLPTAVINETTVMYESRADEVDTFYYTCGGKETVWFEINVDYPPEAQEFHCTSYYDKLACTWRSLSTTNIFNLFYGKTKLLCADRNSETNRECEWSKRFIWDQAFYTNYDISLRFVMQTCNKVFCRNQTFQMTHASITKLEPVSNLSLIGRAHGVTVTWPAPHQGYNRRGREGFKHDYKVEYRLLHKRWRQAAAAVRCDYNQCASELSLDCPEQHYELRVYVKLEGAADRLWSEPAARSFYTGATDVAPTACRAALREPELLSGGRALSELYELISRAMEGRAVLRQQVRDMRLKLREIESLPA